MEAEQRPAENIDPSDRWGKSTTFNDLIDAWKLNGWQDLSPKTVSNYESLCRLYISRSIGKKKVASIGVYDLESYFRTLADKGLGVSGVRQVRAILHKAATLGRKWSNSTLPNPVADSDLPQSLARTAAVRAP